MTTTPSPPGRERRKVLFGKFHKLSHEHFRYLLCLLCLRHLSTRLKASEVFLKFASLLKFDYAACYQLILTRHNTRRQALLLEGCGFVFKIISMCHFIMSFLLPAGVWNSDRPVGTLAWLPFNCLSFAFNLSFKLYDDKGHESFVCNSAGKSYKER